MKWLTCLPGSTFVWTSLFLKNCNQQRVQRKQIEFVCAEQLRGVLRKWQQRGSKQLTSRNLLVERDMNRLKVIEKQITDEKDLIQK